MSERLFAYLFMAGLVIVSWIVVYLAAKHAEGTGGEAKKDPK